MSLQKQQLIFGLSCICIFLGISLMTLPSKEEQTVQNLKYDNCVTEMTNAIPDPNDTQERSKFLKNCYEN